MDLLTVLGQRRFDTLWREALQVFPVTRFGATGMGMDDDMAFASALAAAAAVGGAVLVPPPAVRYGFRQPIVVPAGVRLIGQGRQTVLAPQPGFAANYLVQVASRTALHSLTLDGTNLPHATGDWLGVGTPVGSLLSADGTIGRIDGVQISDVTFQNCPNGAAFLRTTSNWRLQNCAFNNVQADATYVRSAALEFYDDQGSRVIDCLVNGYTMKAYNLGSSIGTIVRSSPAQGGAQDPGHAAHYMDDCTDCSYIDCIHTGTGYGFKAHRSTRPRLVNYEANGSAGGAYFQACKDSQMVGGTLTLSATSKQGVIVQGITTLGAPADTGCIEGVIMRRAVAGTTTDHVGILLIADATNPVKNITIRDVVMENMLYGVQSTNVANATYENIVVENLTAINTQQYAVLLYVKSARIIGGRLECVAAAPSAITLIGTGAAGTNLEVADVIVAGAMAKAVEIGGGGKSDWDSVIVRDVVTDGAGQLLVFNVGTNATDRVGHLSVVNNTLRTAPGATAMSLTFATVNKTQLRLVGNSLRTGAALRNIVVTNGAQVDGGVCYGNDVNAITGKPAALTAGL